MKFIDKTKQLNLKMIIGWITLLLLFSVLILIANQVGYSTPFLEALPGMLILSLIGILGFILERLIPLKIPVIIYISVIGMIIATPISPISTFIIEYTNKVNLLSMSTVILAYSGVAIGRHWNEFKSMSWRGIIVVAFVVFGTYIGSAIVAQIILKMQGII